MLVLGESGGGIAERLKERMRRKEIYIVEEIKNKDRLKSITHLRPQ
jgi:hypothetical protein